MDIQDKKNGDKSPFPNWKILLTTLAFLGCIHPPDAAAQPPSPDPPATSRRADEITKADLQKLETLCRTTYEVVQAQNLVLDDYKNSALRQSQAVSKKLSSLESRVDKLEEAPAQTSEGSTGGSAAGGKLMSSLKAFLRGGVAALVWSLSGRFLG